MSTNTKRKGINRFVCDLSLYVAETPKASIKYHKSPLPIIPFGIVAYGFVGQPFSKQLYNKCCLTTCQPAKIAGSFSVRIHMDNDRLEKLFFRLMTLRASRHEYD